MGTTATLFKGAAVWLVCYKLREECDDEFDGGVD